MSLSSKYKNLSIPYSYSSFLHVKQFLSDVYASGKIRELSSFMIWELKHRLKLYKKGRYLTFENTLPLHLNENFEIPLDAQLSHQIKCFDNLNWDHCVLIPGKGVYAVNKNILSFYSESLEFQEDLYQFDDPIKSIFISAQNDIFIASSGCIFKSPDLGKTFKIVQELDSQISWFLPNNGFTEIPDTKELLFGEYASIWSENTWRSLPFLYFSNDQGETWTKLSSFADSGVNKHLHIVKYSKLLNSVFLTDGDNYKRLWVNNSLTKFNKLNYFGNKEGWKLVNHFHIQKGGHTSMVDGNQKVLFGSDYMGGTNFLVSTVDGKKYTNRIIPDPYRKCPIMNLVSIQTSKGKQIWASLYYSGGHPSKCLLMYSNNDGETWHKFLEYDGSLSAVEIVSQTTLESVNKLFISIFSNGKRKLYAIIST